MNPHALKVLELETALDRVARRAGSEPGRRALRERRPSTDRAWVRSELARVTETRRLLESRPEWAPPLPPDVERALGILKREGSVVAARDLPAVLELLRASRRLRDALSDLDAEAEHLAELRQGLVEREKLEELLERTVDEEGRVRDRASAELRSIRSRLTTARSRIVQRLEGYLAGLPERIRVGDASVSIREGRYVIPIRREGKSEVGGIIHGESGSGATLFVEPPMAIRLMSDLSDLEHEEEREVERILREVSGRLRPDAGPMQHAFDALVRFDTLWARALTARAWDGNEPEVLPGSSRQLEIHEGRHPLLLELDDGPVVPFFLSLGPDERAMVVSGPNTGGKTVLLKAVGLIRLLTQCGVIPPVAAGTRFPVLSDVFADIGDEQSIAESLSTFSAHLERAREILEGAGPDTLVLMDEMGTGTDPAEGAALARAILETLVARGARALVTSHLGALKRLDRPGSGIVNASLAFDPDRIAPTYELRKGRPGRSWGLAIARRLGFPPVVLDRAEGYLDEGEVEVEVLLEQLEQKERQLSSALAEAERLKETAERERQEAREREKVLRERERTAEARAREEARQLLLEARSEVEDAIRQVRSGEEGAADRREVERKARRTIEEAAEEQRRRMPDPQDTPDADRSPATGDEPVSEGSRVQIAGSGTRGIVREVEGDRLTVEVGGLRMRVPRAEAQVVSGPEAEPRRSSGGGRQSSPQASRGSATGPGNLPDVDVSLEADLRGLRVDEVELELGRALDGAIVGGLHELRIIHGKGTGAVKARVQELLERDPRIRSSRPGRSGEGGAGVTVAVLE